MSLLVVLILLLALNIIIFPQGATTPQAKNSEHTSDQNLKSISRVNPSTLAMQLNIPLANYPGRNGDSLPVGISYTSKVWRMKSIATYWYQLPYSQNRQYVTQLLPLFSEQSAAGWTSNINFPVIEERFDVYDQDGNKFNFDFDVDTFNLAVQSSMSEATNTNQPRNLSVCGSTCTGGWTNACYEGKCTAWNCSGWSLTYCDTGGTWNDPDPGGGASPPPPPRQMHYIKRIQVKMGSSIHEFRKSDAAYGYCAGGTN